ncbi:hypothetical protein [Metasolibacillus meyeri]|uniref:hypothetical protein n=1 Tax=Metasolibacillus meyeri TaxID=1071052 RepID=UPI000D31D31B|nr:hypothetical protein [Metasolibacillus meyeri]
MFGFSLTAIYLTVLIVMASCTLLYLVFADLADGVAEGIPYLDPAVILSFISITAAGGYLLERFTSLTSIVAFIIAIIIAAILTALLYFFLLVPLRSAEVSLVYTDASLEGQTAKVIIPIPVDGFGEIVIESINGIISKRAASYQGEEIPYDTKVLIIEVKEGTAFVTSYDKGFSHT